RTSFDPHVLCLYGPTVRATHYGPALEAAGGPYSTLDLGWSMRDKIRGIRALILAVRQFIPALSQAEGYHANLLLRLAAPFLPRHARLIGTIRGAYSRKQLLYERLGSRFCACLVVNAPQLKEMLVARAGISARRVCVIANGIDLEHFALPHATD